MRSFTKKTNDDRCLSGIPLQGMAELFYEQLGFKRLPDEAKYGYGMLLEI